MAVNALGELTTIRAGARLGGRPDREDDYPVLGGNALKGQDKRVGQQRLGGHDPTLPDTPS